MTFVAQSCDLRAKFKLECLDFIFNQETLKCRIHSRLKNPPNKILLAISFPFARHIKTAPPAFLMISKYDADAPDLKILPQFKNEFSWKPD